MEVFLVYIFLQVQYVGMGVCVWECVRESVYMYVSMYVCIRVRVSLRKSGGSLTATRTADNYFSSFEGSCERS